MSKSVETFQKVSRTGVGFDVLIQMYIILTCLAVYRNAFYTPDLMGRQAGLLPAFEVCHKPLTFFKSHSEMFSG